MTDGPRSAAATPLTGNLSNAVWASNASCNGRRSIEQRNNAQGNTTLRQGTRGTAKASSLTATQSRSTVHKQPDGPNSNDVGTSRQPAHVAC